MNVDADAKAAGRPGAPDLRRKMSGDRVFALLYPSLRRFAAAVCSFDFDPDDLVQEALVRALRSGSFDRASDLSAYLRRTILNVELEHRRRQGRWKATRHRVLPAMVADETYPSDLAVLEDLTSMDRAILYFADVEGYAFPLIAEFFDITESSARLRASRSRHRLRKLIEKMEREGM